MTDASPSPAPGDNPLLADWTTPFRAPPFGAIRPEHFAPAFDTALARHRAEVAAIAAEAATPTFANTIGALERSGRALSRVSAAFFALVAAHSNDALLGIERDIVPRLAAHWDAIYMNQALFRRIEALVGVPERRTHDQPVNELPHSTLPRPDHNPLWRPGQNLATSAVGSPAANLDNQRFFEADTSDSFRVVFETHRVRS